MPRPCHIIHPEPVSVGCRACYLYLTDPEIRRRWDKKEEDLTDEDRSRVKPKIIIRTAHREIHEVNNLNNASSVGKVRNRSSAMAESKEARIKRSRERIKNRFTKLNCIHIGEPTGVTITCNSCGGTTKDVPIFGCSIHGKCLKDQVYPDHACCRICPDYTTTINQEKDTRPSKVNDVNKQITRVSPPPPKISLRWAYGVTTVPERMDGLLPRTLESLRNAGFPRPILFVDGCTPGTATEYTKRFNLPVEGRNHRVRAKGNWVMALWEMYLLAPEADRYAIFQDDIVLVSNLRYYLDRCRYPAQGYLNLFTHASNQNLCPKSYLDDQEYKIGWYRSDQLGKGALALVFDNNAVRNVLSSRHMVDSVQDRKIGYRNLDGAVVDSLRKVGIQEWVHNPSLVEHKGDVTTIEGNGRHNPSDSFPDDDFNALGFIPSTNYNSEGKHGYLQTHIDVHQYQGIEVTKEDNKEYRYQRILAMFRREAKQRWVRGKMGLGDVISGALSVVGITEELAEKILGHPCNCKERIEKLNSILSWSYWVRDKSPDKDAAVQEFDKIVSTYDK